MFKLHGLFINEILGGFCVLIILNKFSLFFSFLSPLLFKSKILLIFKKSINKTLNYPASTIFNIIIHI